MQSRLQGFYWKTDIHFYRCGPTVLNYFAVSQSPSLHPGPASVTLGCPVYLICFKDMCWPWGISPHERCALRSASAGVLPLARVHPPLVREKKKACFTSRVGGEDGG